MEVEVEVQKSVEENAAAYFERAKRAKKKLSGLERAAGALEEKKKRFEQKRDAPKKKLVQKRKRAWYEKYRWCRTSGGKLCLAGRDAHTNEELVKKRLEKEDLHFHADASGAAHVVLKDGQRASAAEKSEAAQFAAVWTRAWSAGSASCDVYAVTPKQVSKHAKSGESMGTGGFMIYGKREWFKNTPLSLCVGAAKEGDAWMVVYGPPQAMEKRAALHVHLTPGADQKSQAGKKIRKWLEKRGASVGLEEIMAALPANGIKITVPQ